MRRWAWLLPVLAVAAIFLLRINGPPDFLDKDQPRPIDYIVDVVAEGHWVVQRDPSGAIASKPPLYTWLASFSTLALGGGSLFALYLPCALAIATLVMLAYATCRRRLGFTAALCAATVLVMCSDSQKQVALARNDAVFAACVAATAFLALRAWESGRDRAWVWFWVAGAVATLAKTPLGPVFAAAGLCAAWWGRRDAPVRCRQQASGHAVGVVIFLAITGGWLLAAWLTLGQPVLDKLIGRELLGHALANDLGEPLWKTFPQPVLWYVLRFLPWSIPLAVALWRLVRQPPASLRQRRFLRFCACWLGVGLLILVVSPHKRIDLALPLLLPGAVLAGWELARWLRQLTIGRLVAAVAAVLVLGLGSVATYQHLVRGDEARVASSRQALAAAALLQRYAGTGTRVALCRAPSALRYFIPGMPPVLDVAKARALLAGDAPAAVATSHPTALPEGTIVGSVGEVVVVANPAAAANWR